MNFYGIFHPSNNIGLEAVAIGIIGTAIFMAAVLVWLFYEERKWNRKRAQEASQ